MNQDEVKTEIQRLLRDGGLLNILRGLRDELAEADEKSVPAKIIQNALTTYSGWYHENE